MLSLLHALLSLATKPTTPLVLKSPQRIVPSLWAYIGQKNYCHMSLNMLGGKKQCFLYHFLSGCCLVLSFDQSFSTLVVIS